MIQVKIISQKSNLLERDINQFLVDIGSVPGYKVDLKDIKLYHDKDRDTAMIIFNQYESTLPPVPRPNQQINK